jgi:hypothetical protein
MCWQHLRVYLFFLAAAAVCLWPLSLGLLTFKNDALTYYYPVRTLISDALNNGELPLWTPYINLGYPLHADFQSGAWNPIVWILSLFTKYPLWAMHLECMFYFSIAGFGMYKICRSRGATVWLAIVCGLSFEFSGFMLDSVQFFTAISSACWIPFIFLHFNKILNGGTWKNPALLGLNMSLLLLCGYPAFFIICVYLLAAYFIYFVWVNRKTKNNYVSIFSKIGIAAFLFLLFCLPAIISFYQHLPFISRGESQSLSTVQENSMNPVTFISLLFPFTSQASNGFLHSEPLMRTLYMGILPLCLFVVLLMSGVLRKGKNLLLIITAFVMLLMAFGKYFFLRELAYYVLPGMDMFRHPGLFRLFFIFFFLLFIAEGFRNQNMNVKYLRIAAGTIGGCAIAILIISLIKTSVNHEVNKSVISPSNFIAAGFWLRLIVEACIVLVIAALIYRFAVSVPPAQANTDKNAVDRKKYSKKELRTPTAEPSKSKFLLIVFCFDIFISSQLHLPVTVVGAKSYNRVVSDLNRNPVYFPEPGNSSLSENSVNSISPEFEAGSRMPFRKMVGRNDYFITPGNLSTQDSFYRSPFRDSIMSKPLVSFVNHNGDVQIGKMGANFIEGRINSLGNDELLYLQNIYPNWSVTIDGEKKQIQPAAISFMSVPVDKGRHHFRFIYSPSYLKWAIWFPVLGMLILFRIIFSKDQKAKRQKEIE